MMRVDAFDLDDLRLGNPPLNDQLLSGMTIGREHWLDRFQEHYLYNYLARGGSKVKVLVGSAGAGKTHLLRCVGQDARAMGYTVVYLSAREADYKLNNLPSLYSAVVSQIDKEELIRGLCCCVARNLGYENDQYDGSERLLPLMVEEGLSNSDAKREIRKAVGGTFRELDVGPSFATFGYTVVSNRMVTGNEDAISVAIKWLSGAKLERHEKQATGLFERLQKSNARAWLNSLVYIMQKAGKAGLVVMIDDLEVMTERSPDTRRFLYTTNAIIDTCELFRQLIDDVELLNNFLLLLAGRRAIIEDERRGFQSYEALWMRLQTGLVHGERFNPYCDIVDVDAHLAANGPNFPRDAAHNLSQLLQEMGLKHKFRELADLSGYGELRAGVMECALMTEMEEEFDHDGL